jgi:hypothetical protein
MVDRNHMDLAPIILFVFNRPWHTKKTIEALQKNFLAGESNLFVFSDGPKTVADEPKVQEVRDYIRTFDGFKSISINERDRNFGLADSIINGVTGIVNQYGKIIVLEDDLISSSNFLKFMNQALTTYKGKKEIFSITGYNFLSKIPNGYREQVFLSYRPSSWGWGTWADRWNAADWEVKDFDTFMKNKNEQVRFNRGGDDLTGMLVKQMKGKIDSWGIRWCYTHFKHKAYCLVPVISKIKNIGFDNSGTHCAASGRYDVPLDDCTVEIELPSDIHINEDIVNAVADFHPKTFIQRIKVAIEKCIQ